MDGSRLGWRWRQREKFGVRWAPSRGETKVVVRGVPELVCASSPTNNQERSHVNKEEDDTEEEKQVRQCSR